MIDTPLKSMAVNLGLTIIVALFFYLVFGETTAMVTGALVFGFLSGNVFGVSCTVMVLAEPKRFQKGFDTLQGLVEARQNRR